MKFSKLSQLFLVSSIGLLVATLISACQLVSIDYVYATSAAASGTNGDGQIYVFAADSASGALRMGQPTVPSGGTDPVALVVASNYANLYVANQGTSNNVVHLTMDSNGALTQKDTLTGLGTPVYIAVNQAATYLFAICSQGTGANSATVSVVPLATDGTLGTTPAAPVPLVVPGHADDTIVPTGVFALVNNSAIYVTAYDQSVYNPNGPVVAGDTANPGWVFGFNVGTGGALTPTSGSPYQAGVKPSAVVADPTNRFVYVTDFAESQMIGYTILSDNTLNFFLSPPTKTGNEPDAIVFDPRGKFIYVANALDSTVSAYTIDPATGAPTVTVNTTSGSASNLNATDTTPVALVVDPSLGRFLYSANYLGNSISGFRFNPTSGALTPTQATPYPAGQQPTAIGAIPHGNYEVQSVTP